MRELIYKCDNCKKVLSSSTKHTEHISVNFSGDSGLYTKVNNDNYKKYYGVSGIKQFCLNSNCISEYFNKLNESVIDAVKANKKT